MRIFAVHLNDIMLEMGGVHCCNDVFAVLQYPFLGPPSTRLASALSSGSCQCQAAALQLSVHLQELETVGLGKKTRQQHEADRRLDFARCFLHLPLFLFTLLDESSELQTQICNGFKSLVVQLQGELAAGFVNLQHSKLQICYPSCFLFLSTEILNKCKGDLLEMKEGKLKTRPSLLENLIFFVEVRHRETHDFLPVLDLMC